MRSIAILPEVMRRNSLPSIALSVACIIACGLVGALGGAAIAEWLGLAGTARALVAVLVGMPLAAATFAAGVFVLRRFGAFR